MQSYDRGTQNRQQDTCSRYRNIWRGNTIVVLLAALLILAGGSSAFADTEVSGYISTDMVWTTSGSPYIVIGDVTVRHPSCGTASVTSLMIEPGVEVRFRSGTRLQIGYSSCQGALIAQGTAEKPIIFTSAAASKAPGQWEGIYFDNYSHDAGSIVEQSIIEYGGQSTNANVYLYHAAPTIRHNTIRHSSHSGIYVTGSGSNGALIENNSAIEDNPYGIYVQSAEPTIQGNTIRGSSSAGIYEANASARAHIHNNELSHNSGAALSVEANGVANIGDNIGEGNGTDAILIRAGDMTTSGTWRALEADSLSYLVAGDVRVHFPSAYSSTATLTLEAGTELRFMPGTRLQIGRSGYWGALVAQGSPEEPIRLTSSAESKAPGQWEGLYFDDYTNDTSSLVEHCIIEYGGQSTNANVYLNHATPTIRHNTIRQSSHSGIYVSGSGSNGALIENNSAIEDNPYGIYVQSAEPTIQGNTIRGSSSAGIYEANASARAHIHNNELSHNSGAALSVEANGVANIGDNIGEGNGTDAILIRAGDMTTSGTWRALEADSLSYLVAGDVRVHFPSAYSSTATLTLEAGTELRFMPGTRLQIGRSGYWGALVAQGSPEEPIRLTSSAESKAPGQWEGLYFDDYTNDTSSLVEHCIIEYGGQNTNANVYLNHATPTIRHNTIRQSSHSGIYVSGSGSNGALIENNSAIEDNPYGIYVQSAEPTIQGNTIRGSSSAGIYEANASARAHIHNNELSHNSGAALSVEANGVANIGDNIGEGNGTDAILIRAGDMTTSGTWRALEADSLSYLVAGDVRVHFPSAYSSTATLTLEAGTELRFMPGTRLQIGRSGYWGALVAQGSPEEPIRLTSSAESKAPGQWEGLYFYDYTNDAASLVEHCVIEYGGQSTNANVSLNHAAPTIRHNTIRQSSHSGIYVSGSGSNGALIENNSAIEDNPYGIYVQSAEPTIQGNTIRGSSSAGIYEANASARAHIHNNELSHNSGAALSVEANGVANIGDNIGEGNGTDAILIRAGDMTTSGTWRALEADSLSYLVAGDVRVHFPSAYSSTATLTLEAGTELRFMPGTRLQIGRSGYWGALVAQGSPEEPIRLTSSAESKAPGQWEGLYFDDYTNDTSSLVEHCIIEYGGQSTNANVSLNHAAPTIRHNTIRQSSHSGIYVSGSGSNGALIENNSAIEDNPYGIYVQSAEPTIQGNTIRGSSSAGIYEANASARAHIHNNELSHNSGAALSVEANGVANIGDNIGEGNGTDAILIRAGDMTTSGTWRALEADSLSYLVAGDVRVHFPSAYSSTATLTLEAGTELRFMPGTRLQIGRSGYWGALVAQGSPEEPIRLTSSAESKAPGQWEGLYFYDYTNDAASLVEHCVIEYGGQSTNANLFLENAAPTLRYNTIRASSHSGLYVSGTGSNNATIDCNNFQENRYGVSLAGNANLDFRDNNFLGNSHYGLQNHSSGVTVDATNNWWGDAGGPVLDSSMSLNSDWVSQYVSYDPWLSEPSNCIPSPPTNSAPFAPNTPTPADGAVKVDGASVTLSWSGGDPNPWDTVVYDVWFGDSEATLTKIADSLSAATYTLTDLAEGTSYVWQIIARDDGDPIMETEGPLWSFLTEGPPADLTVSAIAWSPTSDIAAGDEVVFSATLENVGSGPVVDAFTVEFLLDDSRLGLYTLSQQLFPGDTFDVTQRWTATPGEHTIEVLVTLDTDADNSNNEDSATLTLIQDESAPELVSLTPADGALLIELTQVVFRLYDRYSAIDDDAVMQSLEILDSESVSVDGTVTEANDTFTFTAASAFADGDYTVSLTARDTAGNEQIFQSSFSVDGQAPAAPTITGGEVVSGTIRPQPFENRSDSASVTLSGTREDETALLLNGSQRVNLGSGDWNLLLSLAQGNNSLTLISQDRAGNQSDPVLVDIFVDSIAPKITSLTPANGSILNVVPDSLTVAFQEATSGLDESASLLSVTRSGGSEISGSWDFSTPNQAIFTPDTLFADDVYTLELQLADLMGNSDTLRSYSFTLDTLAPPAPEILSPADGSSLSNPNVTIEGAKETFAAILLNGEQIVGNSSETPWQYAVVLDAGTNSFSFTARDRAGNVSEATVLTLDFNDTPPSPLTNLTVDAEGSGTQAVLNWSGYDESEFGDISQYEIYAETASFGDLSGLSPQRTVNAGTFSATLDTLSRDTTYWFAVVPVDSGGQTPDSIQVVEATLSDSIAPADVTNLQVEGFADSLTFRWQAPADEDLAGYRVFFDGDSTGEELTPEILSLDKSGLSQATVYDFRIVTYDRDGNESSGRSITGVTWLDNPANLAVTDEQSGYITIAWEAIDASQVTHLRHYAVYVSETEFSSVEGMSPALTAGSTTTGVSGLTDNTTYYIAVTAVNTAGGQNPAVTTVTAQPLPDTEGPVLSNLAFDGLALTNSATIAAPGKITVNAADPSGVNRVDFSIDDALLRSDYNGTPSYYAFWNVVPLSDGSYTLTMTASDSLGNETSESYTLNVALAAPPAPVMSSPANGLLTNTSNVTVAGSAAQYAEVWLYCNDVLLAEAVTVDAQGHFSTEIELTEGGNRLEAIARYRSDEALSSPRSASVIVTLDTSLPQAPTNLKASSRIDGEIKISWNAPAAADITGYTLYRATEDFTDPAEAELLNPDALLNGTSYTDLPPEDGVYIYRLLTVSEAGNESELSEALHALSDRTPPSAEISYSPTDGAGGGDAPFAPGAVDLILTVSEALQSTPFLSITPHEGLPISLELTKTSDLEYHATFDIEDSTPGGTAYAVFSARDMVGNRGTELSAGGSLEIDTDGPTLTRIAVQPAAPIRNDAAAPVNLTVTFGFDDAMQSGLAPTLSSLLSGPDRDPVTIEGLSEVTPAEGDDVQTWQATFTLPANAGMGLSEALSSEELSFSYEGLDALGNVSAAIAAENRFQIYQGELPALEAPQNLSAEALPDGTIHLSWEAVEDAIGYNLYRQAPGEDELTLLEQIPSSPPFLKGGQGGFYLEYDDSTSLDGEYHYAVSSLREDNGQTAESELCAPVSIVADGTPPDAPQNLTLEAVPQGIYLTWEDALNAEDVFYRVYRAGGTEIFDVSAAHAVIPEIPAEYLDDGVVDPSPSSAEPCYVVTALDAVGNESAPSNSAYHNIGLLPVSSILIRQEDDSAPVLRWTHPSAGSMAGYVLDLDGARLSDDLLTGPSYTDSGYSAGADRRYGLTAVDVNDARSQMREILFPSVQYSVFSAQSSGASLKRGLMNRLDYVVENLSSEAITSARLYVDVEGYAHQSASFSLEAGETSTIPVTIGGYADLPDSAALTTTMTLRPNAGERVEIVRHSTIAVGDGMLTAQILNEAFTRGATGTVSFTLENSGDEQIEILTASGNSASPDIRWELLDDDGNVLSSAPFYQAIGDGLVTLANTTVARIPGGGRFESGPSTITVPANAPDTVMVRLRISRIYAGYGAAEQVTMTGLSSVHQLTLRETSYYGDVLSVSPQESEGKQDIVINGRAIERASGEPMAGVPLNLTIGVSGFDRSYDVLTDDSGSFTYSFTPLPNESGVYSVRAVHPDILDRPVHATFVITMVAVGPPELQLHIPKNYAYSFNLTALTGEGTTLTNFRLRYEAADQPDGTLAEGIQFDLPEPQNIGSGSRVTLPVTIEADNSAEQSGSVSLTAVSEVCDDSDCTTATTRVWETIEVRTQFSDALPALTWSPNYLETGVAREAQVVETIALKNTGLAAFEDLALSIVASDTDASGPEWISFLSAANPGDLPVGGEHEVSLSVHPGAQVTEGVHQYRLKVSSSNADPLYINLFPSVTQSGEGHVLVKVADIYTGTTDADGDLIQGLQGARITLQNETVTSIEQTLSSDSLGEALFEDLPAGRYKCRVRADNHQEYIGRIWVRAGMTSTEEVFLEYTLVTVEWEVNEITIEDRYDIVLKATYQTQVPAPVVIVEPGSVSLPEMQAGDVLQGEFTIANQGLIRADKLQFSLPEDDAYFRYEFLVSVPEQLEARDSLSLPYRVTALQSLVPSDDGDSSGGGDVRYNGCGRVEYEYTCANDHVSQEERPVCFSYYKVETTGSDGGLGMTGWGIFGGGFHKMGGGQNGGGSGGPSSTPIGDGLGCYPEKAPCPFCNNPPTLDDQGTEE